MAAAPAGELIMFIGAAIAAVVVAGSLSGVADDFSSTLHGRGDGLRESVTGHITIVNDPAVVIVNPSTLIYVKNTGTREMDLTSFRILLDGNLCIIASTTVDGAAATRLGVTQTAVFTLNDVAPCAGQDAAGDHRVVVVNDRDHRATLEYNV